MHHGKHDLLTPTERSDLAKIVDDCGLAEVLRALGGMIAHSYFDLGQGVYLRSQICKLAKKFDGDPPGDTEVRSFSAPKKGEPSNPVSLEDIPSAALFEELVRRGLVHRSVDGILYQANAWIGRNQKTNS